MAIDYEILPPELAIRSMRSSGYRDTAHALAELIDNSIQAGQEIQERTEVEVVCVDRIALVQQRQRRQIDAIAVYDNACGMDAATLRMALQFGNGTRLSPAAQKGIGKFGMGLPNASISQCQRVDVWSWQNGECLHTYLDINQIAHGDMRTVPEPTPSTIPEHWASMLRSEQGPHGTLVVWSKIDRVSWKSSRALLENAEFLVGRMYRYFIHEGTARIRLAAYELGDGFAETHFERHVRPNDPLYLMSGTTSPEPFSHRPAFDAFGEPRPVTVTYQNQPCTVWIRFSVATTEVRDLGGSKPIGKHAAKNQGVSVVRARRELEMNQSFDNRYDPRERWWGVEVSFEPELDDVFGVTNNKQAATAFSQMDLEEDAKLQDMTPGEYKEYLRANEDPRLVMYEVSAEIMRNLRTLRDQIKRMAGEPKDDEAVVSFGSAEQIATRAVRRRIEKLGKPGTSDEAELLPDEERTQEIRRTLLDEGVSEDTATQIAVSAVRTHIKFIFQPAPFSGAAFFDIKSSAGTLILNINTRHPAYDQLFEVLREEEADSESPALKALKLLLTAWARLEDEANDTRRQELEDIRQDWGRIARDFLSEASN